MSIQKLCDWLFDSSVIPDEVMYRILFRSILLIGLVALIGVTTAGYTDGGYICSGCTANSFAQHYITFHSSTEAVNFLDGRWTNFNASLWSAVGSGTIDYYWEPYPYQTPDYLAYHARYSIVLGELSDYYYVYGDGVHNSEYAITYNKITIYPKYSSQSPTLPDGYSAFGGSTSSAVPIGLAAIIIPGTAGNQVAPASCHVNINGYGINPTIFSVDSSHGVCDPVNISVIFDNGWGAGLKNYDVSIYNTTMNTKLNHFVGATYNGIFYINTPIISPGNYYVYGWVSYQNTVEYPTNVYFNLYSNCTGTGYIPNESIYPTPLYPNSPWSNNTSWVNLTFPTSTWDIKNFTPIPFFPSSLDFWNLTNRTTITNYFNSTFIPMNLVNGYFDIVDNAIAVLEAFFSQIFNLLLTPLIWINNLIFQINSLFYSVISGIIYYIKPVAVFYQDIFFILPPIYIYAGTLWLIIDFVWWILKGRK